jgi:GNAT superfamily N-acetyltransferase
MTTKSTIIKPLDEDKIEESVRGYTAGMVRRTEHLDDGYVIHTGRYPPHQVSYESLYGYPLVVVHQGTIVGVSRKQLTWVHRDHRGHGLGVELFIELVRQHGPVVITTVRGTPGIAYRGSRRRVTTPGSIMSERAYNVMVERGLLEAVT